MFWSLLQETLVKSQKKNKAMDTLRTQYYVAQYRLFKPAWKKAEPIITSIADNVCIATVYTVNAVCASAPVVVDQVCQTASFLHNSVALLASKKQQQQPNSCAPPSNCALPTDNEKQKKAQPETLVKNL